MLLTSLPRLIMGDSRPRISPLPFHDVIQEDKASFRVGLSGEGEGASLIAKDFLGCCSVRVVSEYIPPPKCRGKELHFHDWGVFFHGINFLFSFFCLKRWRREIRMEKKCCKNSSNSKNNRNNNSNNNI